MKLRISKVCDLSSISVLPPRRTGGSSSAGQGASQLRSQSQQSFSQGISQSQLSQASFDENLLTDQRFNSNNDNSSKIVPSLPAASSTRDESLPLSRITNNFVPRWNNPSSSSSSVRESRCQVSEEIEQRLRQLDGTINRMGMILDSVQSDVLQISRAVKEVSHENDGIRQKMVQSENSLEQVLKGQENIKAVIEESLKGVSDILAKNSNPTKLNEISSVLSVLSDKIQVNFAKLHSEIIRLFSKETQIIVNNMKSFSSREPVPNQTTASRPANDIKPLGKAPVPMIKQLASNPMGNNTRLPVLNKGEEKLKFLQSKLTGNSCTNLPPQKEPIPVRKTKNNIICLDSDEESDGSSSCLIMKKETVEKESCWMKEANEDTLRILRKARKRKRKQMSSLVIKV
ncbi:hypothetical protein LUZ60_014482 [Juncus effusus]|nr:hypothetical protein LUZ60_014482 [Juncus effusus]